MMETPVESTEQRQSPHRGWGGRRRGAGRRPREIDRWIAARGLKPATAAEILERADERRLWYRLLNSEDDGIVLRTITYLTDRRDGRPAQQINVTSFGLQVTTDEVAEARRVVQELMGPNPGLAGASAPPLLEASSADTFASGSCAGSSLPPSPKNCCVGATG
jgi:hypothetical protein